MSPVRQPHTAPLEPLLKHPSRRKLGAVLSAVAAAALAISPVLPASAGGPNVTSKTTDLEPLMERGQLDWAASHGSCGGRLPRKVTVWHVLQDYGSDVSDLPFNFSLSCVGPQPGWITSNAADLDAGDPFETAIPSGGNMPSLHGYWVHSEARSVCMGNKVLVGVNATYDTVQREDPPFSGRFIDTDIIRTFAARCQTLSVASGVASLTGAITTESVTMPQTRTGSPIDLTGATSSGARDCPAEKVLTDVHLTLGQLGQHPDLGGRTGPTAFKLSCAKLEQTKVTAAVAFDTYAWDQTGWNVGMDVSESDTYDLDPALSPLPFKPGPMSWTGRKSGVPTSTYTVSAPAASCPTTLIDDDDVNCTVTVKGKPVVSMTGSALTAVSAGTTYDLDLTVKNDGSAAGDYVIETDLPNTFTIGGEALTGRSIAAGVDPTTATTDVVDIEVTPTASALNGSVTAKFWLLRTGQVRADVTPLTYTLTVSGGTDPTTTTTSTTTTSTTTSTTTTTLPSTTTSTTTTLPSTTSSTTTTSTLPSTTTSTTTTLAGSTTTSTVAGSSTTIAATTTSTTVSATPPTSAPATTAPPETVSPQPQSEVTPTQQDQFGNTIKVAPNGEVQTVAPNGELIEGTTNEALCPRTGDGGVIGDIVNDLNGNNVKDPGEESIGNARIKLLKENTECKRAITHSPYSFKDLKPGEYEVLIAAQPELNIPNARYAVSVRASSTAEAPTLFIKPVRSANNAGPGVGTTQPRSEQPSNGSSNAGNSESAASSVPSAVATAPSQASDEVEAATLALTGASSVRIALIAVLMSIAGWMLMSKRSTTGRK
jgi:hypothetical protein